MAPRVLLLDMEGVLNASEPFSRLLELDHGITLAMTRDFFRGPFVDCNIGRADLMEEIAPYLPDWGWRGTVGDFVDYWFHRDLVPNEPLLARVRQLRVQGVACWLATDQERYRLAHLLALPAFTGQFDGVLASCELGYQKKVPGFWAATLQRLSPASPSEMLFVDDSEPNVLAARAAGLRAEVYTGLASLEGVLQGTHPVSPLPPGE